MMRRRRSGMYQFQSPSSFIVAGTRIERTIVAALISQIGGGSLGATLGGGLASAPLGNLDGWASASTSGIKAHLHFEIWPDGWYATADSHPIDPLPDLLAWAGAA